MNEYMKLARQEAEDGIKHNHGGPFGAVIVDKTGKILATGHNMVLIDHDPTAHGEIVAIRNATKKLGTHDLSDCTLYTSAEPCPMCLSAIIWSNIKTVYYGCTKKDTEAIGFRDDMIYEYIKNEKNNLLNITNIDRDECMEVFNEYIDMERSRY